MKQPGIFYRDETGRETEIREVQGLSGTGALIVQYALLPGTERMEEMEKELSAKLGVKVVAIDSTIQRIMRLSE